MKNHRIYIAGKVSGENQSTCEQKFQDAEDAIIALFAEPLNPLKLVGDWNTTWRAAMRLCIMQMMTASAVYLLPDWQESKGARIEKELADQLGIPVFTDLVLLGQAIELAEIENLISNR